MTSLFKKRTTGKYSPTVQAKSMSNKELSDLIERLQKNADTVENNIMETENKLQRDLENIKQSEAIQYREYTMSKTAESEKLLNVLENDAEGARRMNHPQGEMIVEDIRQLKGRIANLRIKHEQIYSLTPATLPAPQINWSKLIDEKQGTLSSRGYANDLPSVDRQVEEHNLFHKEVEAIGEHINKERDQEYISGLQVKYNKLLSASQQRKNDLSSLQDYMQRCTNELYWLDQQEKDRMQYDWSDHNLDYPSRRRQYENFINRSLEAKEESVNQLHLEGEKLVASGHPGNNAIEAHMEAVHADWKEYLNLLICEESHLKYMEDYHQFHKDAKDAHDLLKKVDIDLDQKYSPDFKDKYQIESLQNELNEQEKALDKYEEVVKTLQKRGQQVVPLKYRRETPLKPIPVEALCDFDCEEGQIYRGQRYILKANKGEKWEVTDQSGKKFNAPGVCFNIPPTDPECIALADSIANQHRTVKKKTSGSRNALVRRHDDLKKDQSGVEARDAQGQQFVSGLDKVYTDLDRQEKVISSQLRPPLEQGRPVEDSAERLKALKNVTNEIHRIEPEMSQQVQESNDFLKSAASSSSAPMLRDKLENTYKKYERVNQLLASAEEKVERANHLETMLKEGKDLLSSYENRLAHEDTVPEDLLSLEKKQQELATINSELQAKKGLLTQVEQNLQKSKITCAELASRFQEHCPDINREESEVGKLSQCYDGLQQQIQNRSQSLHKAKAAYAGYRSGYDDLDHWLSAIPNNEPCETDSVRQVETKLKQQRLLLSEITAREQDLKKVSSNAQQYQQAVKDYELEAETLRSVLDLENRRSGLGPKRTKIHSPAAKIKEEETDLSGRFTEVNVMNKQRMQNLEFAQSLLRQQPEEEIMLSSSQTNRSEKPTEETWKIKKMLEDEVQRRNQLVTEVKTTQSEILLLQNQKPQETVVKKELVKKVPDPQLEDEYYKIQEKMAEEQRSNKSLQGELEALKLKIQALEYEHKEGGQEYVVKEVTRVEKDKEQQDVYLQLREELEELNHQKVTRENELVMLKQRITVLSTEKNQEQEKITEKEVVKLQNDPQLAADYKMLQESMKRESGLRQKQEEELSLLKEKLKHLEKERAMAEGKITVKEVLKVERDQACEREVADLRRQYEEESSKVRITLKEKNELIRKVQILEDENAKVVVQEKVREIVRPDPKAETELANLRLELLEQERKYRSSEDQVNTLKAELTTLKNRGTQVEVKEIVKEVITHKTDPEVQKELEKLREEIVDRTRVIERADVELAQLRQEIQAWKDTKPQVQVKEVVQEVLQYREDPKTKQEVDSFKTQLSEEQTKRLELEKERMSQEEKIRQKERELSQVKEKVVQQEVVKLEEDPTLKAEVNSYAKSIENELKQVDRLQDEMRKLQRRKAELERQLEELERERQGRREAELEIQRLRIRLNELEQRELNTKEKVTLKQKVILQQDPQQEKEHNLLKLQVEEEKHQRQMLETELEALRKKLISLEKTEVKEKLIFTEKVEVERDTETEQEIQRLKVNLEEENRQKRELDADIDQLKARLSEMEFDNSKINKELEHLREETHKLQAEKQSLQMEIRHLQSEIEISVIEAQDLRNMTQVDRGVDLDSRFQSLTHELQELRKISKEKDAEMEELQKRLETMAIKREQRENHLRRSIVVIDPDTGREMSPEEAYKLGLIDRHMFNNLQEQECDWEEISIKGPLGESSMIHDRKSGRQFNIEDALKRGRINKKQYDSYLNKEMSIQDFALLVSGKK